MIGSRTLGSKEDILVVGAGPLGLCTAAALADGSARRVHLVDANDPIQGNFSGLSAACPYAAGQIIIHSFEPGTYAMELGRRTAESLRGLASAGHIDIHRRPWLVCAGNTASALDDAVRGTLDRALREGLLEGCRRVHGSDLDAIPGVRADHIAFAVCDDSAMAMDPRAFAADLARWVVARENVEAHFGFTLRRFDGDGFFAEKENESVVIRAGAVVLCTGIHRLLFPDVIPEIGAVHLHVFDHRDAKHEPALHYSVAGETTVARYEGFGAGRHDIAAHLPEAARAMDINALLTDVPGLRRQLDTHFPSHAEAEARTDEALAALGVLQRRFIAPELLLGGGGDSLPITETHIAQYARCAATSDPVIEALKTPLPALFIQPSRGRGLNQCTALGEDAARTLLGML